ncbi:MKI67 FHA domain-interacting nucleolar phosphoprotein [Portunus trituberculatus]|uniref:MKI67 FHA domain-interacting nucleolar phosphoprotein n=1 Tax=Portunus trituberculatus TaxID=210409 RepID=A0A5B7DP62_PORTR|nr:MKI67 FHA domain-interacting nucleolar phosphoprotein [Portunus trituberculatus]
MAKIKSVKTTKPGPPKAKKTSPLKVKKTVTQKAKKAASPATRKNTAVKFLALKKTADREFRKKTLQKRKFLKEREAQDEGRAVIVLSHTPHGFFEGQIKRYFRQFGVVENVRLVRSKKTGRSCGYAYVEFQHYEVAQIVAKHMDGYLTFGKIMKCKVIPPERATNRLFKFKRIRPDNCPKLENRRKAFRKLNKIRTEKEIKNRIDRLKSSYAMKIEKLQKLGIDIPMQTLLATLPQVTGQKVVD